MAASRRERGQERLQDPAHGMRETIRILWRVPLKRGVDGKGSCAERRSAERLTAAVAMPHSRQE